MLTSEIKRSEPVAKNTRYLTVSKTPEVFGFYINFQIVEEIVNQKDFPRLIHWVEKLQDERFEGFLGLPVHKLLDDEIVEILEAVPV